MANELNWYEGLSIIRWIFAIFGVLVMLLYGWWMLSLIVGMPFSNMRPYDWNNLKFILMLGSVPFLPALLITYLALKAWRK